MSPLAVQIVCIVGYLVIAVLVCIIGMRLEAIEKAKEGVKYKSEGGWVALGVLWAPAGVIIVVGSVFFCIVWVIEHGWEHFHNLVTRGVEVREAKKDDLEEW